MRRALAVARKLVGGLVLDLVLAAGPSARASGAPAVGAASAGASAAPAAGNNTSPLQSFLLSDGSA